VPGNNIVTIMTLCVIIVAQVASAADDSQPQRAACVPNAQIMQLRDADCRDAAVFSQFLHCHAELCELDDETIILATSMTAARPELHGIIAELKVLGVISEMVIGPLREIFAKFPNHPPYDLPMPSGWRTQRSDRRTQRSDRRTRRSAAEMFTLLREVREIWYRNLYKEFYLAEELFYKICEYNRPTLSQKLLKVSMMASADVYRSCYLTKNAHKPSLMVERFSHFSLRDDKLPNQQTLHRVFFQFMKSHETLVNLSDRLLTVANSLRGQGAKQGGYQAQFYMDFDQDVLDLIQHLNELNEAGVIAINPLRLLVRRLKDANDDSDGSDDSDDSDVTWDCGRLHYALQKDLADLKQCFAEHVNVYDSLEKDRHSLQKLMETIQKSSQSFRCDQVYSYSVLSHIPIYKRYLTEREKIVDKCRIKFAKYWSEEECCSDVAV